MPTMLNICSFVANGQYVTHYRLTNNSSIVLWLFVKISSLYQVMFWFDHFLDTFCFPYESILV